MQSECGGCDIRWMCRPLAPGFPVGNKAPLFTGGVRVPPVDDEPPATLRLGELSRVPADSPWCAHPEARSPSALLAAPVISSLSGQIPLTSPSPGCAAGSWCKQDTFLGAAPLLQALSRRNLSASLGVKEIFFDPSGRYVLKVARSSKGLTSSYDAQVALEHSELRRLCIELFHKRADGALPPAARVPYTSPPFKLERAGGDQVTAILQERVSGSFLIKARAPLPFYAALVQGQLLADPHTKRLAAHELEAWAEFLRAGALHDLQWLVDPAGKVWIVDISYAVQRRTDSAAAGFSTGRPPTSSPDLDAYVQQRQVVSALSLALVVALLAEGSTGANALDVALCSSSCDLSCVLTRAPSGLLASSTDPSFKGPSFDHARRIGLKMEQLSGWGEGKPQQGGLGTACGRCGLAAHAPPGSPAAEAGTCLLVGGESEFVDEIALSCKYASSYLLHTTYNLLLTTYYLLLTTYYA